MSRWIILIVSAIQLLGSTTLNSQENLVDELRNSHLINTAYSFQIPFADLGERYGWSSGIGLGYEYKFGNNWLIGTEARFIFGSKIKEQGIFDAITTYQGYFIDNNGLVNDYSLQKRGMAAKLTIGKIVWSPENSPNSGLLISGGIGYLQHKIMINLRAIDFPQISDDLRKGYDRFTSGVQLDQFIGYMYLRPEKLVNFYIGIELIEGFTKLRRPWMLDLNEPGDNSRFDMILGLKAGWIIPAFKGRVSPGDEYFYD